MRFSANVSILFKEYPFLERFAAARAAGFAAVEFWWPQGEDLERVVAAARAADLRVPLFNFDAGNMAGGDRGLISDPARQEQFRANVPVALDLARALGTRKFNALAGHRLPSLTRDEQLSIARENVAWAAEQARAHDAEVLIEAVNTFENGPYLLPTTADALDFIASVGAPNVRLQYDVYHMQRMEGNLVATLRAHLGQIAHIQIADAPGRNEPGTGEIAYCYVLAALDDLGYDGYVGLEYNPTDGKTLESLAWLPMECRGDRPASASDLRL